jgi:hypothetical protein
LVGLIAMGLPVDVEIVLWHRNSYHLAFQSKILPGYGRPRPVPASSTKLSACNSLESWSQACRLRTMRALTFVLTLAMSTLLLAADEPNADKKMTGCLTKASNGDYTLTESSGKQVTAIGSADLEKHAANHKVTLHGTAKIENGKTVFQVERIEHIADSCTAPATQ